ncbi:MAG: hypothetical protein O3B73_10260 [bacterium]|jgi:hypothetical protein|nr:hypothetical protein [bacterium]
MLFRLIAAAGVFLCALAGTAFGNVARVSLDKKYRQKYITPDTEDLIITGVVSNGLISTAIALLTGSRRLWCAFLGGALITFVFGDRLDRHPEDLLSSWRAKHAPDPNPAPAHAPGNGSARESIPLETFAPPEQEH